MAENSMTGVQLTEMICAAYENGVQASMRDANTEALRSEADRAQAECERLKAALVASEQRANGLALERDAAVGERDAYKHICALLEADFRELEAQVAALRDDAALGRQVRAMSWPSTLGREERGGWYSRDRRGEYHGGYDRPQTALTAAGIHAPEPANAEASEQPAPTPMTAADERTAQDIRDAIADGTAKRDAPEPTEEVAKPLYCESCAKSSAYHHKCTGGGCECRACDPVDGKGDYCETDDVADSLRREDAQALAFAAWQKANKCQVCGAVPIGEEGTMLHKDQCDRVKWGQKPNIGRFVWTVPAAEHVRADDSEQASLLRGSGNR